jgi:hypothetical protein
MKYRPILTLFRTKQENRKVHHLCNNNFITGSNFLLLEKPMELKEWLFTVKYTRRPLVHRTVKEKLEDALCGGERRVAEAREISGQTSTLASCKSRLTQRSVNTSRKLCITVKWMYPYIKHTRLTGDQRRAIQEILTTAEFNYTFC